MTLLCDWIEQRYALITTFVVAYVSLLSSSFVAIKQSL